MRSPGLCAGSSGIFLVGLSLVPACSGHGLSSSQDARPGADAGADVAPDLALADQAPIPSEDLAPPAPDLAKSPDLAPGDPSPTPDIFTPRDLPEDRNPTDVPDAYVRDLLPSEYRSFDEPPRPDLPADQAPVTDLPPKLDIAPVDRPPAYDLPNIPDELPQPDLYISPDARGLAELCTSTGGTLGTQTCCPAVSDFRDMCTTAVGACGCSPASSRTVSVCTCPQPSCFLPAYGCVGPGSICTVGTDQTCNDSLMISSIHGRCVENGRCVCLGYPMSSTSGKCL
jgi:hypothetical protein